MAKPDIDYLDDLVKKRSEQWEQVLKEENTRKIDNLLLNKKPFEISKHNDALDALTYATKYIQESTGITPQMLGKFKT